MVQTVTGNLVEVSSSERIEIFNGVPQRKFSLHILSSLHLLTHLFAIGL
jgi:hypothetical protein